MLLADDVVEVEGDDPVGAQASAEDEVAERSGALGHQPVVAVQSADVEWTRVRNRLRRGSHGGRPAGFDTEAYKERNAVEQCIGRLKQWRGLAIDALGGHEGLEVGGGLGGVRDEFEA